MWTCNQSDNALHHTVRLLKPAGPHRQWTKTVDYTIFVAVLLDCTYEKRKSAFRLIIWRGFFLSDSKNGWLWLSHQEMDSEQIQIGLSSIAFDRRSQSNNWCLQLIHTIHRIFHIRRLDYQPGPRAPPWSRPVTRERRKSYHVRDPPIFPKKHDFFFLFSFH